MGKFRKFITWGPSVKTQSAVLIRPFLSPPPAPHIHTPTHTPPKTIASPLKLKTFHSMYLKTFAYLSIEVTMATESWLPFILILPYLFNKDFPFSQENWSLKLTQKSTFSKEVSPSFLSTNPTFSHLFFLAEIMWLKIIFSYSEKHWMIFRPEN